MSTALMGLAAPFAATAATIQGALPWIPGEAYPNPMVKPGGWVFFTLAEARVVEAIADRLIPADDLSIGGKDAGCAVFIDRQLAGPYGRADNSYMQGPFMPGKPTQGPQGQYTPSQVYRRSLAAFDAYCKATYAGKDFASLTPTDQDKVLTGLEKGEVKLDGANGVEFFNLVLQNTQEGFFADPLYGGNRDMAGWKMIGFPGARYDFRDYVSLHNQKYPLPPVALTGRPDWSPKG